MTGDHDTMSEHTPGPWEVSQHHHGYVVRRNGGYVAKDISREEDRHLIAAAPDLLSALVGMIDAFGESHTRLKHAGAIHRAKEAIAKARGEAIKA